MSLAEGWRLDRGWLIWCDVLRDVCEEYENAVQIKSEQIPSPGSGYLPVFASGGNPCALYCGLSSRLDAPHWRRCNAPQSYGATAKKYNSACGRDGPCPSPCARSHHRTSIRPALADILTPLNGLYMTSPSTSS